VQSVPPGAEVRIDDGPAFLADGSRLRVLKGRHELRLALADYEDLVEPIHVPAGEEASTTMRCPLPAGTKLLGAGSHMHRHATGFEASLLDGPRPVYSTTSWADPDPASFMDDPMAVDVPMTRACKLRRTADGGGETFDSIYPATVEVVGPISDAEIEARRRRAPRPSGRGWRPPPVSRCHPTVRHDPPR
jgi:hypothetical protein